MGVWIETSFGVQSSLMAVSHPAWVCGLKQIYKLSIEVDFVSHPAWVCGLKPISATVYSDSQCHTLRGCVD